MTHTILAALTMLAIGAPSTMLILSATGKVPAPRFAKLLGLPALLLFVAVWSYSAAIDAGLRHLISWGVLAGLAGTVALDSIRIPGWLAGWMPIDLPLRFGTLILGLDRPLKLNMMATVNQYVQEQVSRGRQVMEIIGGSVGIPKLALPDVRKIAPRVLGKTAQEAGRSIGQIRASGYLWHYTNGASFGVAHTVLFGQGPWLFTILFGLALATGILTIIQFLIPILRPSGRQISVILLAHVAVIIVLGVITQARVPASANDYSLLHQLLQGLHF